MIDLKLARDRATEVATKIINAELPRLELIIDRDIATAYDKGQFCTTVGVENFDKFTINKAVDMYRKAGYEVHYSDRSVEGEYRSIRRSVIELAWYF